MRVKRVSARDCDTIRCDETSRSCHGAAALSSHYGGHDMLEHSMGMFFAVTKMSLISFWNCVKLIFNVLPCTLNTGLFEMIVGVLTTCRTQYTSDSSMQLHRWIKEFSKFSFMMCGVQ